MDPKNNLKRLISQMDDSYDGALITPGSNLYYLTGLNPKNVLERLFSVIVYPDKKPVLIIPKLYEDYIEQSSIDFENIYVWGDDQDPYKYLEKALKDLKGCNKNLLIEDSMSADVLMKIKDLLGKYSWSSLNSETSRFRKIKSKEEIRHMKKAAEIADQTFEALLEEQLIGKTEIELASRIDLLLKEFGASDTPFETMVASGPNSANPHHFPSKRQIKEKDIVIFDYGAKYKGYCSDISRTVAIKKAPEGSKKVYDIVKSALTKSKEIVKAGIEARQIDKKARDVIVDEGYGENFKHRVGHGIGLDAHEEPYLTGENREKIKKGMTFTIEPGIYLKGRYGIRIEDDIYTLEEEGKSLTKSDRGFICL